MPPPERWDQYGPLGDVVGGTKFVPFKVPLKKELLSSVKDEERFGPLDAIEKIKDKGMRLGLVIDVTYSDKYYHKGEFCQQNIEHEKIYTGGHLVPKDAVIYRFFDVVEKFVKQMKSDDVVIGVHCTHGVNRTGYIVCRYMVERLGIEPMEAMNAFNKARGHSIERENYIEDLMTRKFNPHYVVGDHPPVYKERHKSKGRHKQKHKGAAPTTTGIQQNNDNRHKQESYSNSYQRHRQTSDHHSNSHSGLGEPSYHDSNLGERIRQSSHHYSRSDSRYGQASHHHSNSDGRYGQPSNQQSRSDGRYGQASHHHSNSDGRYGQASRHHNNSDGRYGQPFNQHSNSDRRYGHSSYNQNNNNNGYSNAKIHNDGNRSFHHRQYHNDRNSPYHHRTLNSSMSYPPSNFPSRHHENGYKRKPQNKYNSYPDISICNDYSEYNK